MGLYFFIMVFGDININTEVLKVLSAITSQDNFNFFFILWI